MLFSIPSEHGSISFWHKLHRGSSIRCCRLKGSVPHKTTPPQMPAIHLGDHFHFWSLAVNARCFFFMILSGLTTLDSKDVRKHYLHDCSFVTKNTHKAGSRASTISLFGISVLLFQQVSEFANQKGLSLAVQSFCWACIT